MTFFRSDMVLFSERAFLPLGCVGQCIDFIADEVGVSLFCRKKDGMPRKMGVGLGAIAETVYQGETLVYVDI